MSITYDIPSPGQYLKNQHELYHHAEDCGYMDTALMIAERTNSFIDVLIKSDEYHKEEGR